MRIASALLTFGALAACHLPFIHYATMADVPPVDRSAFAAADSYYLEKAREQAAFLTGCPAAQITVTPVSTKPGSLVARSADGENHIIVDKGVTIAAIGAVGCDRRSLFQVLCGPRQGYGYIQQTPCDIVGSGEAAQSVQEKHREQQEIETEAAQTSAAKK